MKIVREKKPAAPKPITITVRMPEDLLKRLDSKRGSIKREPFIRAVLEQVLGDRGFVLRIKQ